MSGLSFLKAVPGIFQKEDKVILGRKRNVPLLKEKLSESELNHHVHIVGASGFGKTVLLSHFAKQRIHQQKGFLFVDLKGDVETILKFKSFAEKASRSEDVMIFSLTDWKTSCAYNLVGYGSPTQLRDKIILSLNWSEEFYKNQSSSVLLKILIVFCWLRDNKGFNFHVGTILDAITDLQKFLTIAATLPDSEIREKDIALEVQRFLKDSDNYASLQGLRTQLESIVLADFGTLVTSKEPGIELYEAVRLGKIVLFFLDSRRYGETSKVLGKFIIQDLKMVSARIDAELRKTERKPFTVIIDEFADLAQEDFIGFLDRARSSKMSIIVAHQEIADLLKVSPEFARRLMGNTATIYSFLQKSPESAEILSKIAGTKVTWKKTIQTESLFGVSIPTGAGTLREVEEFRIHPNQIKTLRVGECVCIKKYPNSRAHIVYIHPEGN